MVRGLGLGLLISFLVTGAANATNNDITDVKPETLVGQAMAEACEGKLDGEALAKARSKWAGKTVIFDTNVLLNDPYAFYKYPGSTVVIPIAVIEEIDNKKKDSQTGKAARTFFAEFDKLMAKGNPQEGIDLGDGAKVKVDIQDHRAVMNQMNFDMSKADNSILATALSLKNKDANVAIITDDRGMRVKAASVGIQAFRFEYEWVTSADSIQQQFHNLEVSEAQYDRFLQTGELTKPEDFKIRPNQFVMLHTATRAGTDATVARYVYDRLAPEKSRLRRLKDPSKDFGLPFEPKNLEQAMLFDVLFDKQTTLVIVEALPGAGKTFVALVAAVAQLRARAYSQLMLTRPMVDVGDSSGKRLGALPGGVEDKLEQDFNAFYDNLRRIMAKLNGQRDNGGSQGGQGGRGGGKQQASTKKNNGRVSIPNMELLPFVKIRGRSLHDTFVIGDEIQNTNVLEGKTLLTRIGEGSKIVIMGDSSQIDVPYLNELNNGLSVSATLFTQDRWSDEERSQVAFIKLKESVRSDLAKFAAKVFAKPEPEQ